LYSRLLVADSNNDRDGVAAPPVVAVVVTSDPGDWFAEVLGCLRDQTYPTMSVLVVDTGRTDVTERVVAVLPDAVIHRDAELDGFGPAANCVVDLVTGAGFYLFLHDDVAMAPDALQILIDEAFRSNAAIVGPKLVDWNDERIIRSVGMAVDKLGVQAPYADPGELDQQQHDRVRDAFAIQGGATLVRADLFATIDGFDPGIDFLGEDVDLCWRAHVVGGRVIVAPDAVVRHLEALGSRRPDIGRRQRLSRHRLRTISKSYGWLDLLRVLPQAIVWSLGELLLSLVTGRWEQARDVAGSWTWNAKRSTAILAGRRKLKKLRRVRDSDIRRLQVRGSARFTSYLRGQIGEGSRIQDLTARGRELAGAMSDGPRRMAVAVWMSLAAFLLFGARHLITRGVVAFGQFDAMPSSGTLLASFGSSWSDVGLGSSGFAPAGVGLLGLASTLSMGATGLLRMILIVGLIPLGWFGGWRLGGPLGSRRGRLVIALVYAAVPLPYDALALGRWDVLLLYGTMPFIVLRLARLIGVSPYGNRHGEVGRGVADRSVAHQVVALGLLLAVVAAFEPFVLLMAPALAAVLVVASGLTGSVLLPLRAVFMTVLSSTIGGGLHALWWLRYSDDPSAAWQILVGPERGGPSELIDLMRFSVGPWSDSVLLFGLPGIAVLALLLGRDWRAAWAPRAWSIALGSYAAAWISTNDVVGIDLPDAHLLLVPAGVGLAWAAGIAFAAFELDVPRFGIRLRRFTIAVGVLALLASLGPAVGAANGGAFGAPGTDLSGALRFISLEPAEGSYRVLWIGERDLLPAPGRQIDERLWVTTSLDGLPDVRANWLPPVTTADNEMLAVLDAGFEGQTARIGRLLAPFAVRYLIVPQALAPSFAGAEVIEIDPSVINTLGSQLDLKRIATDPSVIVYENTEWRPVRAVTALNNPVLGVSDAATLAVTATGEWFPTLLRSDGPTQFTGEVTTGTIINAVGDADTWSLTVGDQRLDPSEFGGWAAAWNVPAGGQASLVHEAPSGHGWMLLLQWIAWVVVARIAMAEGKLRQNTDVKEPTAAAESGDLS